MPNRKVCIYLESPPNIKFGVYAKKDKSKIFIFGLTPIRNVSLIICPMFITMNVVHNKTK